MMIVKVQLSLFDSHGRSRVLIYDRARTIEWQGDATPELVRLMGGRQKAFFEASINHKTKQIEIVSEAGWQEW